MTQQTFQNIEDKPNSPNQLNIIEITADEASRLNKIYHSKLPKIHSSNIIRNTHYVCYGILYNKTAIGCAIWSSPVAQNRFKNGKKILELRRMALNSRCPKNTASWAISKMIKRIKIKFPEIEKLISYQDTSVHYGTIYKASNWIIGNETKFLSWTTNKRIRNKDQTNAKKIRWEYKLI